MAKMTVNLSDSQLKAVLSSKNLTNAQKLQILQAQGLTKAEAQAKLETLGLSTAEDGTTISTYSLSGALKGLWATIQANPLLPLTLAITAVVSAYQSYKQSVEDQRQSAMDAADAASDELSTITDLYDTYLDAIQALDNNTGSKEDLTEATAALLDALGYEETQIQDLIDEYGDLDSAINSVTVSSLQNDIGALTDGYIAAQKNLTDAAESKHIFKDMNLTYALNSADSNTKNALSAAGINPSDYAQIFSDIDSTFKFHTDDTDRLITAYQRLIELRDILANNMSAEELADSRVFNIISTRISDISDEYEDVIGYIDDINTAVAKLNYIQYVDTNGIPQTTEEFNALTDALEKGAATNQNYVGTEEQINSAIQSVLSQIPSLSEYMTDLTDTTTQAVQALQSWEEVGSVFDEYTNSMTNLASLQEAISDGFVISAEKAREFADVFPEILNSAQATADGQIQLNSDVVNSFLSAKEAELQANIDAQVAALEAEKAVLEAKKSSAQAQLEVAKNVGEGEGQISLDEAEYRIELGNEVTQALIDMGIDEATAYKLAAATMAQNSQEFNSVVASVAEDVDTNLCTAFWDAATSSFTNANAMKTNLATVVKQAHELAKAIKAAITGEVAGTEEVIQGGSTGAQTSKFNVQNSQVTFTGTDYTYEPKTVTLDDLTSDIELDISSYETAIAEIDGKIATLEALRNTSIKDYTTSGSSSKKSGSGSSSKSSTAEDAEKEVEEYIVDIEAYRDALQRVAELEAEQERLESQLDLATTDADKLDIYNKLNDIYKQRQEALHTLNEQRRGIISEKVDELESIGFDIEYDAETNTFYVKNLEHLNELQAETAGEYETLQEATNAYRKEVEQTINDLEDLNDDNQTASETWYTLQKNIADTTEKIDELNMNALSDAVDRIEQAYNDCADAMEKANDALDDQITKEQALYDIMEKHFDATNELAEAQHEADQAIADSRISKAYLSESEYALIYNEEDYAAVSKTISKIGKRINSLTDKYNKQVEDALENDQAYLIENISAEYERQVELKMQELEIAEAELEVTKKQTELNNALEERNVRQLVERDGKLQYEWIANTDTVRTAAESLSDAQYNLQQAQAEKRQQQSLNALQETIDNLEDQQESNNALVEEFGNTVDAVKTKLDELQNPVTSLGDSISLLQTSAVGEFAEAIQDLLDEITKITNTGYSIDVDGIKYTGLNVSGGYASGTRSASSGLHWVDEKGNETYFTNDGVLHDFSGGETVLNAEQTRRLYDLVSGMDVPVSHGSADSILRSLSLDAAKPSETLKSMQNYYNSDNSSKYTFTGGITVNEPTDLNAFVRELKQAVNRKMK
ncbi:MAG: hypothetical protein LUG52_10170 [Clostridia bacterium]|nr:hypothetical protein [Clostridia bacterium]